MELPASRASMQRTSEWKQGWVEEQAAAMCGLEPAATEGGLEPALLQRAVWNQLPQRAVWNQLPHSMKRELVVARSSVSATVFKEMWVPEGA
jgi:hypothetical protein